MMNKNKAYRDQMLWLPKSRINHRGVVSTLQRMCRREPDLLDKGKILLETDTHVVVPRNFPEEGSLPADLEIVDWNMPSTYAKTVIPCNTMPRDEVQGISIEEILDRYPQDGILSLSCGKGKTVVSIIAAAMLQVPVFVVVTTGVVMGGWMSELIGDPQHGIAAKTDLHREDIGIIQGKNCSWEGKPVTLCMLNTLAFHADEWPEEMREYPGLIIYDECHRLGAVEFSRASTIFYGSRLGLSATTYRPDRQEFVFRYHLGPVLYENLEQDLTPSYTFIQVPTKLLPDQTQLVTDVAGNINTSMLNVWLGQHPARNTLIVKEINKMLKTGRNILVLSHSREHTEILQQMLGYGEVVHGGVGSEEERRRRLFSTDVVFATFQLVKEGMNKPELDTLFCVTPFGGEEDSARSSISLPQASGRICRKHDGKQDPMVVIMNDHLINRCSKQIRKMQQEIRNRGVEYNLAKKSFPPYEQVKLFTAMLVKE
jgi:superfamily II DNA or RNA helicase